MSLTLRLGEKVEMEGRLMTVTPKAYDCLPRLRDYLIEVARHGEPVSYGEVVRDLDLPYLPRGMGRLLDLLSEDCHRRNEPSLAALVVSDSSGEVGSDFSGNAAAERRELDLHWRRRRR